MPTCDATPGYNDTAPHPATLTKWKFRAIYRVDRQRFGLAATVAVCFGWGVAGPGAFWALSMMPRSMPMASV